MRSVWGSIIIAVTILAVTLSVCAQKSVMFDSNGNEISNNEFVDIRMANPSYPDATIIKTLGDGTVEFRLQKIPQEGTAAPEFSIKTLDGKKLTPKDLKGKVVILNLWFIGCPACVRQETILNEAKNKFYDTDAIFVAATADSASDVKAYLRNRPSLLPQVADAKSLVDLFRTKTFPRCIVISKEGKIVYWRTVIHATDKFESVIRAELAK